MKKKPICEQLRLGWKGRRGKKPLHAHWKNRPYESIERMKKRLSKERPREFINLERKRP